MHFEFYKMSVTSIGKTNFRNREQTFGIKDVDRRRHVYVIGKTGTGKSTLLENMAIQDIQDGKGMAIVDPHGDLAENVLHFVPKSRINDVLYFNPADLEWPIGFNLLENVSPEKRHLVASGLVGIFKKIWADSWGPRLEYLLRNIILSLLEYPGATLLGVMRIITDDHYRNKVVAKVTDPVIKSFWVDEYSKYNEKFQVEAVSPIQNKVGQFLSSSLIRNVVGQTKSSFDIREMMDEGKIVIMNLAKGRIGEDNASLLGAMMVTQIQLAAMERVDMPEEERKDFYLYVDEFQNFATESFANILSEARKYRLNLTLAHQYIQQLDANKNNNVVRDAVFGNVGTIISFRVGAEDAEALEPEFEPEVTASDLVNLSNYNIYLKLTIDGITSDAFSALTLPPFQQEGPSHRDKIIKNSRERYAAPRSEIEEKISRWSGVVPEDEEASSEEGSDVSASSQEKSPRVDNSSPSNYVQDKRVGQKSDRAKGNSSSSTASASESDSKHNDNKSATERTEYFARCEVCGENIKVPFKPDPNRPVYCKDCLGEAQRLKGEGVIPSIDAYAAFQRGETVEESGEKASVKEKREEEYQDLSSLRDSLKQALQEHQHQNSSKKRGERSSQELQAGEEIEV